MFADDLSGVNCRLSGQLLFLAIMGVDSFIHLKINWLMADLIGREEQQIHKSHVQKARSARFSK